MKINKPKIIKSSTDPKPKTPKKKRYYPKIDHPGRFTSEKMKTMWKDPVIRQKMIDARTNNPDWTQLTSEKVKAMWQDPRIREIYLETVRKPKKVSSKRKRQLQLQQVKMYKASIPANTGRKRSPESIEKQKITCNLKYKKKVVRCIPIRSPFDMVDGIKKEVKQMNRYNTHSGVVTDSEIGTIHE